MDTRALSTAVLDKSPDTEVLFIHSALDDQPWDSSKERPEIHLQCLFALATVAGRLTPSE